VNFTSWTISGLAEGTENYFAATVYDTQNNESDFSEEIAYTPSAHRNNPPNISDEVIIDNGDAGTSYSGRWRTSSGLEPWGLKSLYSRDGATYTWTFVPHESSLYNIQMWWTLTTTRSDNIPVTIEHRGGTDTVYINQQENETQWNSLDQHFFENGANYKVTITSQPGPSSTCADAVRFSRVVSSVMPADVIIDNDGEGTSFTGTARVVIVSEGDGCSACADAKRFSSISQ
jgi:hypothetical protein